MPEQRHRRRSGVFTVTFEHISQPFLRMFLLLILKDLLGLPEYIWILLQWSNYFVYSASHLLHYPLLYCTNPSTMMWINPNMITVGGHFQRTLQNYDYNTKYEVYLYFLIFVYPSKQNLLSVTSNRITTLQSMKFIQIQHYIY